MRAARVLTAATVVALAVAAPGCVVREGATGGLAGGSSGGSGVTRPAEKLTGGVGDDLYGGDWGLTVTNAVSSGFAGEGLTSEPGHRYLLVEIDYENVSSATGVLTAPDFTLVGGSGADYPLMRTDRTEWLWKGDALAKGSRAAGQLYYDVPADSKAFVLQFKPVGSPLFEVTLGELP
ncbi:MAG TPA: DUF4352 domain-containing protein [Coriobacteriia bacterium]